MSQVYHSNARTNQYVRSIIQESNLTNVELAANYGVNVKTISKWKDRESNEDKSSRPNKIYYILTPLALIIPYQIRKQAKLLYN